MEAGETVRNVQCLSKEFGRWSVVLTEEQRNVQCPKKEFGRWSVPLFF